MEKIKCRISAISFKNEENGYAVVRAALQPGGRAVTLVGPLVGVSCGDHIIAEGDWRTDPRYGQQFAVGRWDEELPITAKGIRNYLASVGIAGMGMKTAKKIVDQFGLETFNILDNEPERLAEVPGLGAKLVEKMRSGWGKKREIKNIMAFLQSYGISGNFAAKIHAAYGTRAVDNVRSNPYRLADDIQGIGFRTADSIAANMGYTRDDPRRCQSALTYILNQMADDGHLFDRRESLLEATEKLITAPRPAIEEAFNTMIESGRLVNDHGAIYLPAFYHAETQAAAMLRRLISTPTIPLKNAAKGASGKNNSKEGKRSKIVYDEIQQQAIDMALTSKVMVLTGGPGTGKTTTTLGIIEAFKRFGSKILLCAPTGRAAKRMSEATGMDAKTIHRLLEYNPMEGFPLDGDSPLDGDVLIVDESSMIDMVLFYHLMKAIPGHMRLILVGDTDQLPSVGAGNVLRDIINSGSVPVVRLTRIFRQAQMSNIVMNAHAINAGQLPTITNSAKSDFFFLHVDDDQEIPGLITSLVRDRLPKAYGYHPQEIQVLTPMQRGDLGTTRLNPLIQDAINPRGEQINRRATLFRVFDKVMQVQNDYTKNVFNGDIGRITAIRHDTSTVIVVFEGREVEYDFADLDELTLAYAITIHKSQGSEFPAVIIPVTASHSIMLQRNLIYTAITRAKRLCILVGSPRALAYAVANQPVNSRNTLLASRLRP